MSFNKIPLSSFLMSLCVVIASYQYFILQSEGRLSNPVEQSLQTIVNASIPVGNQPSGIAVNSITNRIYVTNGFSNAVSVIDGITNQVVADIPVGRFPDGITVDPTVDRIYVANAASNSTSVIDGITNKVVSEIALNSIPWAIVDDPKTPTVYVLTDKHIFSIADPNPKAKILANFSKVDKRYGLDIYHNEPPENTIIFFMTNYASNTVRIFAFPYTEKDASLVRIGSYPFGIAFNPKTDKVYVTIPEQDRVLVINRSTAQINDSIKLDFGPHRPHGISIDKDNNIIYVANSHSNTISTINGTIDKIMSSIRAPITPHGIALNPTTKLLYVSQTDSNTVSVINTTTGRPAVAVNFNVKPSAAGYIECKKLPYNDIKRISSNYTLYDLETKLSCYAKPNTGFTFSSWSGTGIMSGQINPLNFNVSGYGMTFTANFANELTLTDYQQNLVAYFAILGPVLAISSIYGIIAITRRKRQLKRHLNHIHSLKRKFDSNEANYLRKLNEKKEEIQNLVIENKLDESNYNLLDKVISQQIENIRKNHSSWPQSGTGAPI